MSAPFAPTVPPIPRGWRRLALRRIGVTASGSGFPLGLQGQSGHEIAFYKVKHLGLADADGVLPDSEDTIDRSTADALGATVFPAGTFVYAKVGAALMLGRVRTLPHEACIDNNMAGLVTSAEVDRGFLFWAMTQVRFDFLVNPGAVPSLSDKNLLAFPLLVPPLPMQRAIADYLDRETAQIDLLIEEQQRLIGLLRERREATWSKVLAEAAFSASTVPIRRVLTSIVDGPFGSSLTAAHYSEFGARVIRLGNIGVNEFKGDDQAFIPLEYAAQLSTHAALPGDVVIAGLGDDRMPLGRAAVVPVELGPAIVKADCYRARPSSAVRPEYLAWVLSAPSTARQIAQLARGSTRARLNTSVVRDLRIPLPDLDTQKRAVAVSARQTNKIDTLIAETDRFIELAQERRKALITAAVTGQIDVRGEMA